MPSIAEKEDKELSFPSFKDFRSKCLEFIFRYFFFLIISLFLGIVGIFKMIDPQNGFPPYTVTSTKGVVLGHHRQAKDSWISVPSEMKKIGLNELMRTGDNGEAALSHKNGIEAYLFPNSRLEIRKPQALSFNWLSDRLHLKEGKLFVSVQDMGMRKTLQLSVPGESKTYQKGNVSLQASTPRILIEAYSAKFIIESNTKGVALRILALNGSVKILEPETHREFVMLREGEKIQLENLQDQVKPQPISFTDISFLRDFDAVPFLKQTYAVFQLGNDRKIEEELSRNRYPVLSAVENYEISYTRNGAYASYEEGALSDPVLGKPIRFFYQVTPEDSYADISFKLKPQDLKKFKFLTLKFKSLPTFAFPDRFAIELKSKGKQVRVLNAKGFDPQDGNLKLPLAFERNLELDEIAVCIRNRTVGDSKEGAILFEELTLTSL